MSKRTSFGICAVLVVSTTLAGAVWSSRHDRQTLSVAAAPSSTVLASRFRAQLVLPTPTPVAAATVVAATGESALAEVLAGDDDLAKVAAIERAVDDGAVAELPVLAGANLARSPGAAPAIIHGLARLAAEGGSAADGAAASHALSRWLSEERNREGRDAVGNVPNIIETLGALGAAGGRESVDALVALLDNGAESDLAIETLTVQQLAALGDPRGKDAIQHFLGRVRGREPSSTATEDTFERELETEAIAAATEALQRL